MDTKLTLKLEQDVIERAKDYAKSRKTSLSKLVENYLQQITKENKPSDAITPLVKSLSGIIQLPDDLDEKAAYADYLAAKYR